MKFLWITKDVPLRAETGAQAYSNGLLRSFAAAGATGTLIAYDGPNREYDKVEGLTVAKLAPPSRLRALSLLSNLQSDAYRLAGAGMEDLIRRALSADTDVVVIDYFAMGWVLPLVQSLLQSRKRKPLLVYVSHNFETQVRMQVARSNANPLMRWVMTIDAAKAGRIERDLMAAADLIVANTDYDNAAYKAASPNTPTLTLMPAYTGVISPTEPISAARPRQVALVGAFTWIAKRESLKNFVAAAEAPFRGAGIELLVVGSVPKDLQTELESKSSICKFAGWVDQIRPALASARIGVMPDEVGGGFKHKYLEYIFAGLPVACIRSQASGLPLDIDRDMMAADDIRGAIKRIVEKIDDIDALNGMRERAWAACARSFSWADRGQKLYETLDAQLKETAHGRKAS